jgi:branched-chain amino acid transport system substrate-binding protein
MRRVASSTIAIGLLAGVLTLAAGCSDTGSPDTPVPSRPNTNKITLGVVVSLTGPAQSLGDEAKRGVEVAVAHLNAIGGVLGKRLEIKIVNDDSKPESTVQRVNELIAEGITIGVGPSTSAEAELLKDLILSDKVVLVSPSATSEVLDKLNGEVIPEPPPGEAPVQPVFFRTAATDIFLSAALSAYASGSPEGTTARRCNSLVLVQQDDNYGRPIGEGIKKYYSRLDLEEPITLLLDPGVDNRQKLAAVAAAAGTTRIKQTPQPFVNCQIVVAQPEVAGNYMQAFKDHVAKRPGDRDWTQFLTIGSDGFRQNEFITAGRADPADTTAPTAGEGAIAVAADTSPGIPEFSAFFNQFKARFPKDEPGRYGSTAYDATIMLAAAIERAGGVTDHKAVRDALYKLKNGTRVGPNKLTDMFDALRRGEDINYEGASGSIDFTPAGHVQSAFGAWKIEQSKFVPVETFDVADLNANL